VEESWKDDSGTLIMYLIFTVGLELVSNWFKGNKAGFTYSSRLSLFNRL